MPVMLVIDLFRAYLLLSFLAATGDEIWLLLLPTSTALYRWFYLWFSLWV